VLSHRLRRRYADQIGTSFRRVTSVADSRGTALVVHVEGCHARRCLLIRAIPQPKRQRANALTAQEFALPVLVESCSIAISFGHDRQPSKNRWMLLSRLAHAGQCECTILESSRRATATEYVDEHRVDHPQHRNRGRHREARRAGRRTPRPIASGIRQPSVACRSPSVARVRPPALTETPTVGRRSAQSGGRSRPCQKKRIVFAAGVRVRGRRPPSGPGDLAEPSFWPVSTNPRSGNRWYREPAPSTSHGLGALRPGVRNQ
jgi:hypothetical protein